MLIELVAKNQILRAAAPAMDVFDSGAEDLNRAGLVGSWRVLFSFG